MHSNLLGLICCQRRKEYRESGYHSPHNQDPVELRVYDLDLGFAYHVTPTASFSRVGAAKGLSFLKTALRTSGLPLDHRVRAVANSLTPSTLIRISAQTTIGSYTMSPNEPQTLNPKPTQASN